MRWRRLAPAGTPLGVRDLARWAGRPATGETGTVALVDALRSQLQLRQALPVSTGRAGLTVLLRALYGIAAVGRDEVVLPAYTCYSVAASVVKAGLRPRLVDIDPQTLDYCPEQLRSADYRRVLAIVATNLYGLPSDLPFIVRIASEHGVFVVDDAAQAMGAAIGGTRSGSWGDAGVFSFDKGKNLAALEGGVVVTQSEAVWSALQAQSRTLESASAGRLPVDVLKVLAFAVFLRPWMYGLPARVPQLGLGQTVFSTDFSIARPSPVLIRLAASLIPRLDALNDARRLRARQWAAALDGLPGVRPVRVHPASRPVFLRYPVLIESEQARRDVLDSLRDFGATASYPRALVDVPELQGHIANQAVETPGGRQVSRSIVTLPTHGYVTAQDIVQAATIASGVWTRTPPSDRHNAVTSVAMRSPR